MDFSKFLIILTCYLTIFAQRTMSQFGGMGYFPYGYNGVGGMFGRRGNTYPNSVGGGYPSYGYYPQYPIYGNYLCYQSIYCSGGYGGYPYYGNSLSRAFASSSSSSGFSTAYASSGGGFFG